jgi:hypothetical protein
MRQLAPCGQYWESRINVTGDAEVLDAAGQVAQLRSENERLRRLVAETGRVLAEARRARQAVVAGLPDGASGSASELGHTNRTQTIMLSDDGHGRSPVAGAGDPAAVPGTHVVNGIALERSTIPDEGSTAWLGQVPGHDLQVSASGATLSVVRPALADAMDRPASATGLDLLADPRARFTPAATAEVPDHAVGSTSDTTPPASKATPDADAAEVSRKGRRARLSRSKTEPDSPSEPETDAGAVPSADGADPAPAQPRPEIPGALADLVQASQELLGQLAGLAGWYSDAVEEDGFVSDASDAVATVLLRHVADAATGLRAVTEALPRGLAERAEGRQPRLALSGSIARLELLAERADEARALLATPAETAGPAPVATPADVDADIDMTTIDLDHTADR